MKVAEKKIIKCFRGFPYAKNGNCQCYCEQALTLRMLRMVIVNVLVNKH